MDENHDTAPEGESCSGNADGEAQEPLIREVQSKTLSEALGTPIYPIAEKVAKYVQWGVDKAEDGIAALVQRARFEKAVRLANEFADIWTEMMNDADAAEKFEKVKDVYVEAASSKFDDPKILKMWREIFEAIKDDDPHTEVLISALRSLSNAERHYIANFHEGGRKYVTINPFLQAISLRPRIKRQSEYEVLARGLQEKGLLEQKFPLSNYIILFLVILCFTLLGGEIARETIKAYGINVSSANIVIFLGGFGILVSWLIAAMKTNTAKLTWVGSRLHEAANRVRREANNSSEKTEDKD